MKLWNTLKNKLEEGNIFYENQENDLEEFENFLASFDIIDNKSMAFRFPLNKKNVFYFKKDDSINIDSYLKQAHDARMFLNSLYHFLINTSSF